MISAILLLIERDDIRDISKLNLLSTCHEFRDLLRYTIFTDYRNYNNVKYLDQYLYFTKGSKKLRCTSLLDNFKNLYTLNYQRDCIDPRIKSIQYNIPCRIENIPKTVRNVFVDVGCVICTTIPNTVLNLYITSNFTSHFIEFEDIGLKQITESQTLNRKSGPLYIHFKCVYRGIGFSGMDIFIKR